MARNGSQPSRRGKQILISMTVSPEAVRLIEKHAKTLNMSKSRIVDIAIKRFSATDDDLRAIRLQELRAELAQLESEA